MRVFLVLIGMAAAMAQPWEPVPHSEIIKWPVDAVQTPDGALWIAAAPQVYRYDGRRFETFGESQGLISRGAMYLAVDGTGAVLAGTTEGLFRMEGGQFRRIFEGLVRFVAVGKAGLVAISTGEGKLILGKEVGKIWKWHRVETPRAVWGQVSFDRHGAMLFGCAESICEVAADQAKDWSSLSIKNIRRTRPRLSQQHQNLKGLVILGVGRDRWGRIWLRDWYRLYVADRVDGDFRERRFDVIAGTGTAAIRLSRAGVAYFASMSGLAIGNAKGELEWTGNRNDPARFGGSFAYWDDQGLVWMGQSGRGLLRREVGVPLYKGWGAEDGLDSPVFAIHRLEGGRTLAGTLRGIFELERGEERWKPLKETLERFGGVPAMSTAKDGSVLFGVNRGPAALARMERNGHVSGTYLVPPAIDGPNVYTMLADPGGFWWVGSSRRLYQARENGKDVRITPVPLPTRELGNTIYNLMLDEEGRLWAPTRYGLFRGLFRKDGDRVEQWTGKDGFLHDDMRFMARDRSGAYWISYGNKPGLSVARFGLKGVEVRHAPAALGFGEIADLLADRRGWIWIGDDKGLWVNRTGGLDEAAFERVGEEIRQLAQGINTMSLHEDEAGRIWASGSDGTIRIDDPVLFVEQRTTPPPVTISGFIFSGREGDPLEMQLHAPRLRGMEAVRFRWRLQQGEWTVSGDGAVRIPAMPAGSFAFEAQAEHKEGYWRSAVLRQPIRSVVPWWRTAWFWWPVVLSVLGSGAWLARRRRRTKAEAAEYAAARLAFLEERKSMPVFGDRYRGVAVIASGGFATVYRAEDESEAGREVAVKVLHQEENTIAELARKQLEREVESLRRISHPGVVGVLDFSIGGERGAYLVLDYVPGPTLREVLRKGALPNERVAVLARQLGAALGAAHEAGVIHRDLKPENIILRPEGDGERAVIVDFGIAVCKPPGQTSAQTSNVGGTLYYLAPEQLAGVARSSADIYSFAVILCEALTGECPAISEEEGLEGRARVAEGLMRSIGDEARALICTAMSYDASERPREAAAFGDAVARLLT